MMKASPQVPLALIEGRVPFILWPPSRAGRVESHLPPGRLLVKNDEIAMDMVCTSYGSLLLHLCDTRFLSET